MPLAHYITAIRSGSHDVFGDWENEYVIAYTYTPGTPASYDDPGSGPLVEFVKVVSVDGTPPEKAAADAGAFWDYALRDMNDWAEGWLEDNTDEAAAFAEYDRHAEADDYADFKRRERIDMRLTGDDR